MEGGGGRGWRGREVKGVGSGGWREGGGRGKEGGGRGGTEGREGAR